MSKIVGYREAVEISKKCGVSDTSIRDIIESKKTTAGYDVINKIELFLNRVFPDFELSIENPLTLRSYSQDYISEVASEIKYEADSLKHYCYDLIEMARSQKLKTLWDGTEIPATYQIERSINALSKLKEQVGKCMWINHLDIFLKTDVFSPPISAQ